MEQKGGGDVAEKLAKCKTCEKEVAPTATKCPHCGQKFPAGGAGKGCLVLIAILLVGGFIESMCSTPKTTAELRTERIEKSFSPYDGSHRGVTAAIKGVMHNPDSFENVQTSYIDKGDYLIVSTKFRGTNAFGALVTNTAVFKADLDGNILEVISDGQ